MASESSLDSMWMDNLEEWVGDQNEVVTVKSLSRGLKVRNTLHLQPDLAYVRPSVLRQIRIRTSSDWQGIGGITCDSCRCLIFYLARLGYIILIFHSSGPRECSQRDALRLRSEEEARA